MTKSALTAKDLEKLRAAITFFEHPSLLMKLANLAGLPAQKLLEFVPPQVTKITDDALRQAMDWSIATVSATPNYDELEDAFQSDGWSAFWHRLAATASGGVGGAFGLAGLAIELPITTGIMFRSIASIAAELGQDLSNPTTRLECLTVFAMGGPGPNDDALDSTYVSSRMAMTLLVREAAEFLATRTPQAVADALAKGTAPKLVALVAKIASKFNVVVSQKLIAQSVPLVGIASGAAINNAFAGHFNTAAKHHFTILDLERRFGVETIHNELRRISGEVKRSGRKQLNADEPSGGLAP
jgi:hypothetical protein